MSYYTSCLVVHRDQEPGLSLVKSLILNSSKLHWSQGRYLFTETSVVSMPQGVESWRGSLRLMEGRKIWQKFMRDNARIPPLLHR